MDDRELDQRLTLLEQMQRDNNTMMVKLLEIKGYVIDKDGNIKERPRK